MTNLRQTKIGSVQISLTSQDQYNDYSVVADHFITVDYGNGRSARFDVGTNKSVAVSKFNAAVVLASQSGVRQAA